MSKWELAQAMHENIKEHGYQGKSGSNVFEFIMRGINVDGLIDIFPAHQLAQPYLRQVQISTSFWEVVSEVIHCDRSLGMYIYQDELHHMDALEYVGQTIGQQLRCEIMDDIYVHGGRLDFRLDTEDDSPKVLMEKLWKASISHKDTFESALMYDKWILPSNLVNALLPYLYASGNFFHNEDEFSSTTEIALLGTYQGIEIYHSYRNTVALLCYYGGQNDAGEVLVPYLMKTDYAPEYNGYRLELVYGLKNLHPDYFVSLQVR